MSRVGMLTFALVFFALLTANIAAAAPARAARRVSAALLLRSE